MLRERRLRGSEPGTEFTEKELPVQEAQISMYFNKRPCSVITAEAKKKRAKQAEREVRLASLDQLNAWQNMLCGHYGKHFGSFPDAQARHTRMTTDMRLRQTSRWVCVCVCV